MDGESKAPYWPEEQPGLEPVDIENLSPLMKVRIAKLMAKSPNANVQEIAHMVIAERDGIAKERKISPEEAEQLLKDL